ncbi:MerR family transcriptional regulator [Actinoplanes sp. NPDC051470]|uniref:MerR family transcriptional regulator n=1 Tax=unclassified Actinoplanes TaxID=2626549 RepID=UPI0034437598
MSIGDLSRQTGVPATTLRYYDELGLVKPDSRAAAGRRRYAASAVRAVGVIVFLREVGLSLADIGDFLAGDRPSQHHIIDRKLADLAEQQDRIETARTALEHGKRCPAAEPMQCPRFWSIIERLQGGLTVKESHSRAH